MEMASAKVSKVRMRNSSSKKDLTESDGKSSPNINNFELLSTVGKLDLSHQQRAMFVMLKGVDLRISKKFENLIFSIYIYILGLRCALKDI